MSILVYGDYVRVSVERVQRDFVRFDPVTGEKLIKKSIVPQISVSVGHSEKVLPEETETFEEFLKMYPMCSEKDGWGKLIFKRLDTMFKSFGADHQYEPPENTLGYWAKSRVSGNYDCLVGVVVAENYGRSGPTYISTPEFCQAQEQFQKLIRPCVEFFGVSFQPGFYLIANPSGY